MKLEISGGSQESGIVVGNAYDKYNSRNPLVKWMMKGFSSALSDFTTKAAPKTIHEVGCGEGYWVLHWSKLGIQTRGCDFSKTVIDIAKNNARSANLSPDIFRECSIYDLTPGQDGADLIVCCEVLEHLEQPRAALSVLQKVVTKYLIVSVPREPIWCALNIARGKYLRELGNTPGHIQHWSKKEFIKEVSEYFEVVEIRSPFPWTMLLCRPHK